MKILIACEYSGTVRDAFAKKGHDATSCDLLPTDKEGKHYQGNVEDILHLRWDMIIAHPPCTYLANSGVRWLHKDPLRWSKLDEAAKFFRRFLEHQCEKIVVENPIPHGYALERIGGRKYTQIIQPYQFGHPESKRTCLWLKGVKPLEESDNVKYIYDALPKKQAQKMHYLPPSKYRWKLRSKTYQGIADAMADQWG